MSMSAEGLRISRLLMRTAGEAVVVRRSALVGNAAADLAGCVQVRRVSRDRKGRRIVERWTEAAR